MEQIIAAALVVCLMLVSAVVKSPKTPIGSGPDDY